MFPGAFNNALHQHNSNSNLNQQKHHQNNHHQNNHHHQHHHGSQEGFFQQGQNHGYDNSYGGQNGYPQHQQQPCNDPNYAQQYSQQPQYQQGPGYNLPQQQYQQQQQYPQQPPPQYYQPQGYPQNNAPYGYNNQQQYQQQHQSQSHNSGIGGIGGMLLSKITGSSGHGGATSLSGLGALGKMFTGGGGGGGYREGPSDGDQPQHQPQGGQNATGYAMPNCHAPPQAGVQIVNGVPRIVSGNKRALLIGINYTGTKSALQGCHADVENIKKLIVEMYGFCTDPEHMLVLMDTDESKQSNDPWKLPLRKSIEAAMKWLVGGAQPGDSLFLHYSGHGTQVKDKNGDEYDGQDSALVPLDFEQNGLIVDDDIHDMMVRVLPAGVKLTAILDCCNSGTAMDLPFVYLPDGRVKHDPSVLSMISGDAMQTGLAFISGNKAAAAKGVMSMFKKVSGFQSVDHENVRRVKTSLADVISLSGCKDSQTSADANINNAKTGAMSWALNSALRANPTQSYAHLLGSIRDLLRPKFSQIPQLSAGRQLDMSQIFAL